MADFRGEFCHLCNQRHDMDKPCPGERAASPEQPSQPEPDEVESAMVAAIVGELGQMMLTTGTQLPLDWAPRLARAAKQASDAAVLRYLEREEPSAYEVRAGEARPGAADPEQQDVLSAADHLMEYADRISGPTERLAVVQLAKRLRGALSGGAAEPEP